MDSPAAGVGGIRDMMPTMPLAAALRASGALDRYSCFLDDQPDHLLPARGRESARMPNVDWRSLIVNPRLCITDANRMPAGTTPALADAFLFPARIGWVESAGGLLPFWLGPEFASLVARLHPGERASGDLPPRMLQTLADAGLLVARDDGARHDSPGEAPIARAARQFGQEGYAPVAGLIHPFHIAALRRYYRRLVRTGEARLGDSQSPSRYVLHNESVARFFHERITPAVAAVVGQPIRPSYVYFASYIAGAVLSPHTDREQCEFSVTLCLDYSPEPALATPWPLQLETGSKKVSVFQAIGDGLVYRGRRLSHYRDALPPGHASTSLFFHYVPASFTGPVD